MTGVCLSYRLKVYTSLVHKYYFQKILGHYVICLGLKDDDNIMFIIQHSIETKDKNQPFSNLELSLFRLSGNSICTCPRHVSQKETCWLRDFALIQQTLEGIYARHCVDFNWLLPPLHLSFCDNGI